MRIYRNESFVFYLLMEKYFCPGLEVFWIHSKAPFSVFSLQPERIKTYLKKKKAAQILL